MTIEQRKALEFLQNNKLATLATISSERNVPEVAFVYYLTDENAHIYIVTLTESRKIKNIIRNSSVALCIAREKEPMVLQVEGVAGVVDDEQKKKFIAGQYLDLANESNPEYRNLPPIMKISSESGFMILEIAITHFKFSDFSSKEALIIEGTPQDWHRVS